MTEQYTDQLTVNELEYKDSLAREKEVLNERYIESIFSKSRYYSRFI